MKSHTAILIAALGVSVASLTELHAQDPVVQRRQLRAPEIIDGMHCAPTGSFSAENYLSGALYSCPVLNDTVIAGHTLFAGTWITLDTLRRLEHAWLSLNTVLAGHLCKGTGYKGYSTRFRDDGSLRLCFLAEDAEINGVPCIHGSFWTEIRGGRKSILLVHANGTLAGCQASRTFTAHGVRYRKWDRVARDSSGALKRVDRAQ